MLSKAIWDYIFTVCRAIGCCFNVIDIHKCYKDIYNRRLNMKH